MITRPPFRKFPELTDGIVVLKELTGTEEGLMEILTYDGKPVESHEESKAVLEKIKTNYENGSGINWGIFSAENELIGTCGFYRGFVNEQGEAGFIIRERFRGKGFMSAALKLMVRFGSEHMELKRIIAETRITNVNSRQVLERNHFRLVKELAENYLEYEYARQ